MKYASNDPRPLSDIAVIDQQSLDYIVENIEVPGAMWGNITGTLSAQTDLDLSLAGKSPTSHNHSGVYESYGVVFLHESSYNHGNIATAYNHSQSAHPTAWGKYF